MRKEIHNAYMLENGHVLILMANGDMSDGDQVFDKSLFDFDKGLADLDRDGDMWTFEPCDDKERIREIKSLVLEMEAERRGKKSEKSGTISNDELYELKCDGVLKHTGTEWECYLKLQKLQSFSAQWAMMHNGWSITKK
jgi:hypothetical protein